MILVKGIDLESYQFVKSHIKDGLGLSFGEKKLAGHDGTFLGLKLNSVCDSSYKAVLSHFAVS